MNDAIIHGSFLCRLVSEVHRLYPNKCNSKIKSATGGRKSNFVLQSIHPAFPLLSYALCALFLVSCSSTSFYVPVTRPAEVNLLAYKRIAIGEFQQDVSWSSSPFRKSLGQDIADEITRALLQTGKFEVLDYRVIQDMKIGGEKNIESTCMLTGRISELKYDEDKKSVEVRRKDRPPVMNNIRRGMVRMEVNLQITDLSGGRIVWNQRFRSQTEGTKEAIEQEPPPIDEDILRTQAQSIILNDFLSRIAPIEEHVPVTMLTDSDMEILEKGIMLAKRGKWEDAIAIFSQATEQYKALEQVHKAWFNLGVAHQYRYDFRKAEEALQKAIALKDETLYKHQLQSCYDMEKEYLELLRQRQQIK